MKILVANLSGNMGKTTIVKHLLSPRMPDARVVCFESINAGSNEIESATQLSADDEFGALVDIMAIEDELIVDLGSSESKQMIRKLKEYESAILDFDCVIVPVVPDPKAQEDTISTVMTLNALGLPKEKIRILFNRVPVHQAGKVSILFSQLIETVQGMAIADTAFTLLQYEIYNSLKGTSATVTDISSDHTDWKAVARNSELAESERIDALQNNRNQKAAPTALRNLDTVFDLLVM